MEGLVTIDCAARAKGRGLLYGLLAKAFLREPSAALLEALSSPEAASILGSLGMKKDLAFEGARDEHLNALSEEYTALFILPGGVSPYESVRTKGLLCQEPEWKAREFYKRCGLEIPGNSNVFADHIGMELGFMAFLCGEESKAWDAVDEDGAVKWLLLEREFFGSHLDRWAFAFLDEVKKYSAHPFYRGISALARDFLSIEKEDLLAG